MNNWVLRTECEVCGASAGDALIARRFDDQAVWSFLDRYYAGRVDKAILEDACFEIRRCPACGFMWQAQVLNPELMNKLYCTWISPEDSLNKKRRADVSLYAQYAREIELISRLLRKRPFELNVLDFGMGWGYWCSMAQAFGYNVWGYEVAADRVAYACSRGIRALSDFAEVLSRRYDFINAEQVFEHIPCPREVLRRLRGALAPAGLIRVSVPDGTGMPQRLSQPDWQAAHDALHPLEHINCFTHRSLVRLGREAGLRVFAFPPVGESAPIGRVRRGVRRVAEAARRWVGASPPVCSGTLLYFSDAGGPP